MAENETTDNKANAAAPAAAKGSMPQMLILLIGIPVICYLMVNFLVLPKLLAKAGGDAHGKEKTAGAHGEAGEHGATKENTVDFGKFMVNVESAEDNRFLRINLVFGSNSPEIKEIVKSNDVALRDAAITVLSAQSAADLEKSDGREITRRALLSRVNGVLGGPVVSQIYFTDFVIQ